MGLGVKVAAPLMIGEVREVTEAEMSAQPTGVSPQQRLSKLRARHHALAKALALGMEPGVAGATYGYAPAYVSVLQADPAFTELVRHYRAEGDFDYVRMKERLEALSFEAASELLHRLEERPEDVSNKELLRLLELTADRTGHGPKVINDTNITVNFGARLQEARQRLEAQQAVKTLELTAEPTNE